MPRMPSQKSIDVCRSAPTIVMWWTPWLCLVARAGARLTDDKILVTPRPDRKLDPSEQIGPMILSTDGKLLWYEPRPDKVHDLKVIDVGGRRTLAFWQRHGAGDAYYQL